MKLVIGMIALLILPLHVTAQEPAPVEQRLVEVLPSGWIHDGVVVTPSGAQLYFQSLFKRLGTFPPEFFGDDARAYAAVWTFTPCAPASKNGHAIRQARVSPVGAQWRVIVDGQLGKSYLQIRDGSLTLSPNNARLAYVARKTDGWHLIVSGVEGPPAAEISAPVFSPDSRHIAGIAGQGGKYWITRDGKPGKAYAAIIEGSLTFSGNSARLAYVAREGKQYRMVLDGQAGPGFDQIGPPVFSPDSKHLAYAARQGKRWLVVRDGKAGPLKDYAWGPLFSADSRRLAYTARVGRKAQVIVDGRAGRSHDAVFNYQFSPNGKRLAYIIRDDRHFHAVIDGVEGKAYARIPTARPSLRFSPDSKRVAYVAQNAGAEFIVVNGVEGERFDFIEGPVFSPDSRRLAYVVCENQKAFMVIDGQPEPTFQAVGTPSFGPGGRVAYTAKLAGQWCVSVAENEGPSCSLIFNPSSDAGIELSAGAQNQLTYRLEQPVNQQWVIFQYVVPEHLTPEYQSGVFWAQNGKRTVLRYLAVKNGTIVWVERPVL